MKRSIAVLMTVTMVLTILTGCGNRNTPDGKYKLYYCHSEYQYAADSGVLSWEYYTPSAAADFEYVLQRYLRGPESKDMVAPFPSGLRLVALELKENKAQITLTKELAELSGVDLTIACACITLTVWDLTQLATVDIRAQDVLLNNQKSIIMNAEELILSDIVSTNK